MSSIERKINCIAVCLFGMEATVSYELKNLGIEIGTVSDGRVGFLATPFEIAKANIFFTNGGESVNSHRKFSGKNL